MKRKAFSMVLLVALVLSIGLTASAAAPETVSPQWENYSRCEPKLTFTSSTANCDLYIKANDSNAKINATMTLYRINANGSRTQVATWPNLTGTGQLSASKTHFPVVSGSTYHLVISGTVGGEPISAYQSKTCP